ncbi:uncharacterized protein LOC114681179 [Peromyscus leucopus]|uniref:uncharacterized protein LOC114681179 n=1 Tax=Peromyscus leucopus TaxID=10041 RepID=UPI00188496C1|nr:uncharacterized protein LOC114681179 [Peromyscus leucopus]
MTEVSSCRRLKSANDLRTPAGEGCLNTQTSSPAPALLCLEQVSAPGFKYLDLQPVPTVGGTLSKPSKRPPPASTTPFCFSLFPQPNTAPATTWFVCSGSERKKFTASRTLPLCKFLPKLNWGVQWGGGSVAPGPALNPHPHPWQRKAHPRSLFNCTKLLHRAAFWLPASCHLQAPFCPREAWVLRLREDQCSHSSLKRSSQGSLKPAWSHGSN